MKKQKYYGVERRQKGVFTSWDEAEKQVKGYVGAEYKAFDSRLEADAALGSGYGAYKGRPSSLGKWKTASVQPVRPCICVDAACSGSPGPVEYRGVDLEMGRELFHAGPFKSGTNNVGEFLAIVHALSWLEKHERRMPIYSDSESDRLGIRGGATKLVHTALSAPCSSNPQRPNGWRRMNYGRMRY
jgi:ribonuclease HI